METKIKIIEIENIEEMRLNYPLVTQLTPTLTMDKYQKYLQEMIPHNYHQIIAKFNEVIVGLSGYWIATKLYCGKYLEVDNFVVDKQYRSQKIGHLLLKKLEEIALRHACDVMMLDAYLQNESAHKFYEKHEFKAKGYHFIKKISSIQNANDCLKE